MKLKNRFIRMAMAFAIVGVVASQIPARPSVSLAADGYTDPGNGLLSLKGAGGAAVGGVLVGAVYGAIVNAGKTGGGGVMKGAGVSGTAPIAEIVDKKDEFSELAKLINSSGTTDRYSSGSYTLFGPNNESLTKTFTSNQLSLLNSPAGSAMAKAFLDSITIEGSYGLARLKDAAAQGKTLKTLSGGSLVLTLEGDNILINRVGTISEYPASNGWVISTNGVVAQDE